MDFKQSFQNDLHQHYADMLKERAARPFKMEKNVKSFQFFKDKNAKYHQRLEAERQAFNEGRSAVKIAHRQRLENEEQAAYERKKDKAYRRYCFAKFLRVICLLSPCALAVIIGKDIFSNSVLYERNLSFGWLVFLWGALSLLAIGYGIWGLARGSSPFVYEEHAPRKKVQHESTRPAVILAVIVCSLCFINAAAYVHYYDEIPLRREYAAYLEQFSFSDSYGGGYCVEAREGVGLVGEIEIPSRYKGKDVVEISEYAFEGQSEITAIVVPDTVQTIGKGAFKGCNRLEEITLPFVGGSKSFSAYKAVFGYIFDYEDGDTSGGYYGYTDELGSDMVVDWNTDNRVMSWGASDDFINRKIGTVPGAIWQYSAHNHLGSFYYYPQSYYYYIPQSLRKVTITNSTYVPVAAFNNCKMLDEIIFTKGITFQGECAFQYCPAVIG